MVIGSNLPDDGEFERGREIVSISRVHHMDNTNPMNLRMFQERFERTGKFWLMAAHWREGQAQPILYDTTMITKSSIRIAPAWQLGDNDLDSAAIGLEDDPIIPTTVLDAPVLRLLERRKLGFKSSFRNR